SYHTKGYNKPWRRAVASKKCCVITFATYNKRDCNKYSKVASNGNENLGRSHVVLLFAAKVRI
ncbi:MAG: hypothetical protein ABF274_11005, partial [Nonlabens sp.]|uniref:hypothetical protein n=1 Tax=Nonlabens sp. TaxID=1888209 RepID=UPI00321BA266